MTASKNNNDDYTTDTYPIEGCKIVIEFRYGKYTFRVYRPGTQIEASLPSLEAYAFYPIGSIGVSLDAWVRRIKPSLKKMENAHKKFQKFTQSQNNSR